MNQRSTPPAAFLHHLRRTVAPILACGLASAQWVEPGVTSLRVLSGAHAGDLFGWATRVVPDVDRDGIPEIAVTAPFHRTAVYGEGRLALFSGGNGQLLWNVFGSAAGGIFGTMLETVADLDADGRDDFVVGQPYAPAGGLVRLIGSASGQVLRTLTGPAPSASFGYAAATGGDVDGDGSDDVVIAATNDSLAGSNAGRLYVWSTNGTLLRTIDRPNAQVVEFGCQLEFVPDRDGDGRDELVVGARQAGNLAAGFLFLLLPTANGVTVGWTASGFHHGTSIQGDRLVTAHDLDGDGVRELWLGEPSAARGQLLSPANGQTLRTFTGTAGEWSGEGSPIADVNHDGVDDLAIGGRGHAAGGQFSGRLYLHSGRDGRLLRTMTSLMVRSSFGSPTVPFVDVDGDGARELLVSAPGGTQWGTGRVFVMRGEPCLAGWRRQGPGFPGTNGLPALVPDADPMLGSTVGLAIGNSAPTTTTAVLVLGLAAANLPTAAGPVLWVQPDAVGWLTVPSTGTVSALPIPNDPTFCGLAVHAQSLLLDGGATAGVAASDSVVLTLGA